MQQQQTMLAMGSNTLMPYGHKRAQAAYATQSATLLRSSNHSYNGAFQVSSYFKVNTFLVQEIFQHVRPPVFCLHQRYYGLLNQKNYLQVVIFL